MTENEANIGDDGRAAAMKSEMQCDNASENEYGGKLINTMWRNDVMAMASAKYRKCKINEVICAANGNHG